MEDYYQHVKPIWKMFRFLHILVIILRELTGLEMSVMHQDCSTIWYGKVNKNTHNTAQHINQHHACNHTGAHCNRVNARLLHSLFCMDTILVCDVW